MLTFIPDLAESGSDSTTYDQHFCPCSRLILRSASLIRDDLDGLPIGSHLFHPLLSWRNLPCSALPCPQAEELQAI